MLPLESVASFAVSGDKKRSNKLCRLFSMNKSESKPDQPKSPVVVESGQEENKLPDALQQNKASTIQQSPKFGLTEDEKLSRTIFVGNVPVSTSKKSLKKVFAEFGPIETVRFRASGPTTEKLTRKAIIIKRTFSDTCSHINAYVVFRTEDAAHRALQRNGFELEGLHLRVDSAVPSKPDTAHSIFVGNLPFELNEEMFQAAFRDCGPVVNCRLIRDRFTKIGKGFGYIQFKDQNSVDAALSMDGQIRIENRPVRIQRCSHSTRSSSTPAQKGRRNQQERGLANKHFAASRKKRRLNEPQSSVKTNFGSQSSSSYERAVSKVGKKFLPKVAKNARRWRQAEGKLSGTGDSKRLGRRRQRTNKFKGLTCVKDPRI